MADNDFPYFVGEKNVSIWLGAELPQPGVKNDMCTLCVLLHCVLMSYTMNSGNPTGNP